MKFTVIVVLTLWCSVFWAQESTIKFVPFWGEQVVQFPFEDQTSSGDSVYLDECKFYISSVGIGSNEQVHWSEPESFHLIDLSSAESRMLALETPESLSFNTISFTLGIDSLTSTSGVFGGALDPTNGMYWTWHSGYIFSKFEGTSPSSNARKNRFQFHLGGYQGPYAAQRELRLQVDPTREIIIAVDLQVFFEAVDLKEAPQVMIPGEQAHHLSKAAASMFHVAQFKRNE